MSNLYQAGRHKGFDYSYIPTDRGYQLSLNGVFMGYHQEPDARKAIDALSPALTTIHALDHAMLTLRMDQATDKYLVEQWEKYGEQLAFRKEECRRAYKRHGYIDLTLAELQRLKEQILHLNSLDIPQLAPVEPVEQLRQVEPVEQLRQVEPVEQLRQVEPVEQAAPVEQLRQVESYPDWLLNLPDTPVEQLDQEKNKRSAV